jgi:hypothetical protein
MTDDHEPRLRDLEARVIALQTLVGDLLRAVHASAPEELDRRLEAARRRRDVLVSKASEDVGREAVHLEIAMLEAAVRSAPPARGGANDDAAS